jgi:hypothetical protein
MVTELPKFGAMGLEMPYQGDKMSMVFILPDKGSCVLLMFFLCGPFGYLYFQFLM